MAKTSKNDVSLYLHIGTGKTASTYLQSFLSLNYRRLLLQGVLYPEALRKPGQLGNGDKPWILMEPLRALLMFDSSDFYREWYNITGLKCSDEDISFMIKFTLVEARRHKANKIIISNENFSFDSAYPPLLKKFTEELNPNSVKVIIYWRPQDDLYDSLVNQFIKFNALTDYRINLPSYYEIINQYAELFGEENIVLRPFQRSQLLEGNIVKDFFSILGAEYSHDYLVPSECDGNKSIQGFSLVEIMRLCNKHLDVDLEDLRILGRFFSSIGIKDQVKFSAFESHIIRKSYFQSFDAVNKDLAKRFLGRDDGKFFLENSDASLTYDFCNSQLNLSNVALSFSALFLQHEKSILSFEERISGLESNARRGNKAKLSNQASASKLLKCHKPIKIHRLKVNLGRTCYRRKFRKLFKPSEINIDTDLSSVED